MILSPVDAELGRGNSQLQIATRSGTNRYTGSASWNAMNSALNANTWDNNHTPFTDPFSGDRTEYTPKTWTNRHQWTVAYGGPIKIPGLYDGRNKTFFYGVVSQNIRNTREQVTGATVLTATARQGIFRYWSGYNPVGWNPAAAIANPVYPMTATTASLIAVNDRGEPVRPLADPTSPTGNPNAAGFIPYSGALTCFSIFGDMRLNGNGSLVPFTAADCPGGQAILPTGRPAWDDKRPIADTSGLISKFVQATPLPNYFGAGDGLNYGQIRWMRGREGTANTTTALGGTDTNANITQYNVKIDHNISSQHKVAGSWTYQRDLSAVSPPLYPEGYFGVTTRRPHTLTFNATSTLGPRMVNEGRYGLTYTLNNQAPPWEHPDENIRAGARDLMLPAGTNARSGDPYLGLVNSASGNVAINNGFMGTTLFTNYQRSYRHTLADTLSWTTGRHAFKFGGEYRMTSTAGNGGSQAYPTVNLGNASATATPSPFATTGNFNTPGDSVGYLPGLLNAAVAGSGVTAARTNVTSLLYYLSGSVSGISHPYWITSPSNVTDGYWEDIATQGERIRTQKSQDIGLFVKDDFKVTRNLTLNLGVRWDFFGSPYFEGGVTSIFKDGYGAFGATRTASGSLEQFNSDPFSYFLRPGNLYLTGYGSSTTNPLSCQNGVQQNTSLPTSTCNPDSLAQVIFVGPGSPNPNQRAIPATYGNFGPAIGFAYALPWFGQGKTTIRGGYQHTFGSAGGNRGTIGGGTEASLGNAPGVVTQGTLASHINDSIYQNILATRAITLGDIHSLVPMAPDQALPGGALTPYGLSAGPQALLGWSVYDPNLKPTYTQNITLSVTRAVSRLVTVDVRYTGTLGRRLSGTLDINQNNVYHNPELFQALTDARAGTCTPNAAGYEANYTSKGINPCNINGDPVILDQLLAGLNLNLNTTGVGGTGSFGNVGTVNAQGIYQSGAQQMRRSATFQQNLSFGNFDGVADSLILLAPTGGPNNTVGGQGRQPLPINPATGGPLTGIGQTGLRNGCDRMANGFNIVQQTTAGGAQVANSGTAIPLRCFAEDWLHANPQFGSTAGTSVAYRTNTGRSSYNSLQTQVTIRPTAGLSGTATWVWAKSFNLPGTGYMNPADRNLDFAVQPLNAHALRVNGTWELPVGPNKLLLANSSGLVARILERWQFGFIYNASSSVTSTLNPGSSHFYNLSNYEVASPSWKLPKSDSTWIEGETTGHIFRDQFIGVTDPSCSDPTIVTAGDRMGTNLSAANNGPCAITAIARQNPDGTAGEVLLKYPEPGKKGSLGKSNIQGLGDWRFDVNLSKSFTFSENKSAQIRFDATNILNHPNLDTPSLSGATLGVIQGKGNNVRTIQGSLRLNF